MYRVNREGQFNVPIGTRSNVIRDTDRFEEASLILQRAELFAIDFEKLIAQAQDGDLLFVDPPYTVKHDNNNFQRYNETLFSWDDQVRLRDCLLEACQRGAFVVLTNANHSSVRKLYRGQFDLHSVKRRSDIAAEPNRRGIARELLIRSNGAQ